MRQILTFRTIILKGYFFKEISHIIEGAQTGL